MRLVLMAAILLAAVLGSTTPATAGEDDNKEGLVLGLFFGPAIPSDAISDIYTDLDENGVGSAYDHASSLGYTVGGKVRIGLSDAFSLSGGVSFVQFPGQDLVLSDPASGITYNLESTTNIIPIQAGVTWLPIRSILIPYVGGHFLYTYQNTTVSDGNIIQDILEPGQEIEPQVSRFGASLSAGLEVNLGIRPFIDFTYVWSNLIGRDEGEEVKPFLTVTLGLVL